MEQLQEISGKKKSGSPKTKLMQNWAKAGAPHNESSPLYLASELNSIEPKMAPDGCQITCGEWSGMTGSISDFNAKKAISVVSSLNYRLMRGIF